MTKTFTFTNNTNNFGNFCKSTDYSKILDDIILSDVIKKNDYLFSSEPIIFTGGALKDDDEFIKATTFLANYKTKKTYSLPYILGKMYTLSDGTPIVFYDDEIQIGFDIYKYSKFSDKLFINSLKPKTKKIIITIYGDANININL